MTPPVGSPSGGWCGSCLNCGSKRWNRGIFFPPGVGKTDGGIMKRFGRAAGWGLPRFLLKTRGAFLGETDEVVEGLGALRSILGMLTLTGAALWWPNLARDQPNQFQGKPGHSEAFHVGNFVANWFAGMLGAVVISAFYVIIFALILLLATRSGARGAVLRGLRWPLSAIASLAGFFALGGGVAAAAGQMRTWANAQNLPVRALVYIVMLVLLVTSVVWMLKALYFAAVDVFRAADGHPLLGPLVTTALVWTMALISLVEGGAHGVPGTAGLCLVLGGPVTVTGLNVYACKRLRDRWGTVLFRNGPPDGRGR